MNIRHKDEVEGRPLFCDELSFCGVCADSSDGGISRRTIKCFVRIIHCSLLFVILDILLFLRYISLVSKANIEFR